MKQKTLFKQPPIQCEICGKNLLLPNQTGNFVLLKRKTKRDEDSPLFFELAYYCCKTPCDRQLRNKALERSDLEEYRWDEICRYLEPIGFLRKMMGWINDFRNGVQMSEQAAEKLDELFMAGYLEVTRDLNEEEEGSLKKYLDTDWIGV